MPAAGKGPLASAVVAKAEDGDDRRGGTYLLIMVVMVFVLIFFPDIATWLPENLRQVPQ